MLVTPGNSNHSRQCYPTFDYHANVPFSVQPLSALHYNSDLNILEDRVTGSIPIKLIDQISILSHSMEPLSLQLGL
jgi:hypothetical protein